MVEVIQATTPLRNTPKVPNGMLLKDNIKLITSTKTDMETNIKGTHMENRITKAKQRQIRKPRSFLVNLKGNKENILKNNENMKSNGQEEVQVLVVIR